jgi:hypothetical protein
LNASALVEIASSDLPFTAAEKAAGLAASARNASAFLAIDAKALGSRPIADMAAGSFDSARNAEASLAIPAEADGLRAAAANALGSLA